MEQRITCRGTSQFRILGKTSSRLLRKDVACTSLLGALQERYASPKAVGYLRKKLAELLGKHAREVDAELAEQRARLARTDERIAGLVQFISEGDRSTYVRQALLDLEAQAKTEKRAIAETKKNASKPIELPSPDRVLARCANLEAFVRAEPLRAREALRKLFDDERLFVAPGEDGTYRARGRIFPLAFFALDLDAGNSEAPLSRGFGAALSSGSCAGVQLDFPAQAPAGLPDIWIPISMSVSVGWGDAR